MKHISQLLEHCGVPTLRTKIEEIVYDTKTGHDVLSAQCTFGDGGHYYHDGYDRAVCQCGWRSAPSRDHKALVALWDIHRRDAK